MMDRLDEAVDHVRGVREGRLVVECGECECPYSRQAFRAIERVESQLGDGVRFAFRHFPLTDIHPRGLDGGGGGGPAGAFWELRELLFRR